MEHARIDPKAVGHAHLPQRLGQSVAVVQQAVEFGRGNEGRRQAAQIGSEIVKPRVGKIGR